MKAVRSIYAPPNKSFDTDARLRASHQSFFDNVGWLSLAPVNSSVRRLHWMKFITTLKKYIKHPNLWWGIFALLLLTPMLLLALIKNPDDWKRVQTLHQIAADTPLYPGFKEIGSHEGANSQNAGISYYYRSTASYEEVKVFYTKELTAKGWSGPRGEPTGDSTIGINFRKGEYSIHIYYDGSAVRDDDWNYSIAYSWGMP